MTVLAVISMLLAIQSNPLPTSHSEGSPTKPCDALWASLRNASASPASRQPRPRTVGENLATVVGTQDGVLREYEQAVLGPVCSKLLERGCLTGGSCSVEINQTQAHVMERVLNRPDTYGLPVAFAAAMFDAIVSSKSKDVRRIALSWLSECAPPANLAFAAHQAASIQRAGLEQAGGVSRCSLVYMVLNHVEKEEPARSATPACEWGRTLLGWRRDVSSRLIHAVCAVRERVLRTHPDSEER